ncbi:hypothetical protein GJ496_009921 [Pomphorhynchus laevis]|nr:hypothetical protein GJ496_009921 [Pomphorhynchus laevis]
MERILGVESRVSKGQKSLVISIISSSEPKLILLMLDEISWIEWHKSLTDAVIKSRQHLEASGDKAVKIYGAQIESNSNIMSNNKTSLD